MEAVEDEEGQADARDDAPRQEPVEPAVHNWILTWNPADRTN